MKLINGLLLASIFTGGTVQAGFIDNMKSIFVKSEPQEPIVGVLVAHDVPGVVLEVKGKYKIFDPHTREYISTRFIGKRKFVQAIPDGIKWGEEFPSVHQIQIVPDDAKVTTVVDGIEYSGVVTVYDIGGTISVVNDVPLDDYVLAVLNPYYTSDLPEEMANALVIAERTNALNQLRNAPSRYFTFDRENVNYTGYAGIVKDEGFHKAVSETRNMIMVKNDAPFAIELFSSVKNGQLPNFGRLSYEQALDLAKKGDHAAQILKQAFPNSAITLLNSIK